MVPFAGKEEDRELERAKVDEVLNNDLQLPNEDFTFALVSSTGVEAHRHAGLALRADVCPV